MPDTPQPQIMDDVSGAMVPQPLRATDYPALMPRGWVCFPRAPGGQGRVAFHRGRISMLADRPGGGTIVVLGDEVEDVAATMDEVLDAIAEHDRGGR